MSTKHGIYEFNKEQLEKAGDYEQWLFRVRNTETGNSFTYKVAISGSALASERLLEDIRLTVKSQGGPGSTRTLKRRYKPWSQPRTSNRGHSPRRRIGSNGKTSSLLGCGWGQA